MNLIKMTLVAMTLSVVTGCSTWDRMDRSEKGTVLGAGAGALGGAALSGGGVLGTAAGAAVGGVVGHEVGRRQDKKDD